MAVEKPRFIIEEKDKKRVEEEFKETGVQFTQLLALLLNLDPRKRI